MRSLLVTGAIPVAGGNRAGHLAALVAADVLVRRARADGSGLPWVAAVVPGGLAGQREVEEELVRQGLDKAMVGPEEFAARLDAQAEDGRRQLASLTAALGLELDVEAAATMGEAATLAARTAFVRLFEAGLVVEADRVVGTCPRCVTAVAGADAVGVELEGEVLTLRVALIDGAGGDGHLELCCVAPELLPGVVAVAVPEDSPLAGTSAVVPITASLVPVVADTSVGAPTLVVPAHDAAALELARRHSFAPVAALDADGAVCAPGPLAGLARYAARAAARQLLDAEGALVAAAGQAEAAERCPACRTVLVPLLARTWSLAMTDLETAGADALRDGRLVVWPATAREEVLSAAGTGEWCLSQQVAGGVPVPIGRCMDCGHVDVSVHPSTSCGTCMGDLVPSDDVLDARFVRCVWPLAATGWPEAAGGADEGVGGSILLVVPADAVGEILPMVALGLRLNGAVPFDEVAIMWPTGAAPDPDEMPAPVDVATLLADEGRRVVRVALACGGLDVAVAREMVARLDDPPAGLVDVARLAEAVAGAFAAAAPAAAVGMLAAAVGEGVPTAEAGAVRALAAPFVGG